MRSYFYGIGLALALLILLLACSAGISSPPPPPVPTLAPTPTLEQVTITWAFWGDPWEVAINERLIQIFEADNPHIHVETFHRPWGSYFTELRTRFDAGEPAPDVLFWSQPAIDTPKGYFMDLTPLVEAENYDLNDFFPGLLVLYRVDDRIYGFPRDSDTKVIYYNKRLFNRAGLPYPKAGWTWAELRQTALALKSANAVEYSFAYEANDWWMIWMWQNGIEVFNDKLAPTESDLGQPGAAEAVQFLADLTNVDGVTPPYEQLNSTAIAALFMEGKLAMAFGNHALIPAFVDAPDLEWDVVGLPQQQRRANLSAGAGYLISAETAHPDAAWTFLKFLSGPKGQAIFAESGVAVPARRSVARSEIFMRQRPPHNASVFLEETEIGEPNFSFPGANSTVSLINEALVPVWRGQQDAASAIRSVLPAVEEVVTENQRPKSHSQ